MTNSPHTLKTGVHKGLLPFTGLDLGDTSINPSWKQKNLTGAWPNWWVPNFSERRGLGGWTGRPRKFPADSWDFFFFK